MAGRWQAILLDFDGVILESNDARTEGFRRLFAAHPAALVERFVEYHVRNGGLSRYRKIEHFHRELLGREISPGERDRLAGRFSELVFDLVLASPFVPGARAFIESRAEPLFLASGSDQDELRRICARLAIAGRFREILGSPAPKTELVSSLLRRHTLEPTRVVLVGDSLNDLDAARANGIAFVARGIRPDWAPPPLSCVGDLRELDSVLDGDFL